MDDILKIDQYFDFHDEDYTIEKSHGLYYLNSTKFNSCANNMEGLLMAAARELELNG